jgi:membrane protein YdbS with pleckstrin-like domain
MDDPAMSLPEKTAPEPGLRPPQHRVSPRAVYYWFTRALIGWLAVIGLQVISWVFDWPVPPWRPQVFVVTLLLAVGHLAVMPVWRYRVHRWELNQGAVYTRSGWWTQEWRIAPVTRVQTVDSERGPLSRLFRLAKVTVTTASAAGPLVIDGLDDAVATAFSSEVTAAAQAAKGDAT